MATDSDSQSLYQFGQQHITKGISRITEGIMMKGEGTYVVYDDGRRMLDFTCGIGVTGLGEKFSEFVRFPKEALELNIYDLSPEFNIQIFMQRLPLIFLVSMTYDIIPRACSSQSQ